MLEMNLRVFALQILGRDFLNVWYSSAVKLLGLEFFFRGRVFVSDWNILLIFGVEVEI